MCRHLGYLGPPVPLADLVLDRPHALVHQAWAPADMRQGGTINVDGFGVGWYVPGRAEPVRYRRAVPMWTDESFLSIAAGVSSGAVLGAIRSATVGMPGGEDACAPFADGRWLFSHNGVIRGWPSSVESLAARLPVADLLRLAAPTDSVTLWALVRNRLQSGMSAADAVAATVAEVGAAAPDSRLNVMLTDGTELVATTWWHSLSVLCTEDSVVVASEPWDDDPRWQSIDDRQLVVATLRPDGPHVTVRPLRSSMIEVHLPPDHAARSLAADVRAGLTASPKTLPPKWFYDARGSELFERITRLEEYYPTRAEREVLAARAAEIASASDAHTLVELGSGSSEKTRLLLDALRDNDSLRQIVVLDVSETALRDASSALRDEYPSAQVHGVVGDFTEHLSLLPGESPRLVAFLGGTIGNLLPAERAKFLSSVRDVLSPGDSFLLGTDLVKDEQTLVAAYDDASGVTAEFNRNVLHVLNRELNADFDVAAFEHVARWNADEERIEMRLRATRAMRVHLPGVDLEVSFEQGEELLTEVSAKFRRETVAAELTAAGFALREWWTDSEGRFAVSLASAE
ncbi:dimethylhistidine N-methyltransferase/ergothioneine biosynthesis protein EgtC,TIGR03442 [Labedaea rhizosphaerae]|uniref:Multifunctional fusion protein n=2 Tax=Labedaea rhizosphaerae TaxID=598644 RepID=A0A4R6S078_LABRH|nr:dimethylhistidine N-methyltransferase/ergothioneine biosynthesis protein EgtC,TIGR03442 [Labedaea rhizosphaerae]